MLRNPILIVPGQLDSIFFEILFKILKKKKFLSPLILICSSDNFKMNAKRFNFSSNIRLINSKFNNNNLNNKVFNLIDIKIDINKNKTNQTKYHNQYIKDCLETAFKILKSKKTNKFLNGPINKKRFLNKKFLGMTELISKRFNKKNYGMLIYNKNLSVSPVTTHLPVKLIAKKISKELVYKKLVLINNFFKKNFRFTPRIGVLGLNPHCESILSFNEDEKIIPLAIKLAKKNNILASGPYSADTIFLKQNRNNFDVILGMYHDQVLTPLKTLYEYDAINITMGLPFLRVSPDHGPNEKMVNKNLSNPTSLIKALEFLDKY